jgi:ABC-2 type transport system ATP-binding protein
MTAAVIQVQELTKEVVSSFRRKRVRILDQFSLTVNAGETFGLLGLNGAGKTTVVKLMIGLSRPTSGTVTVLGRPAGDRQSLARIGFLPENPYFYSHLTAREFLDFVGSLFGIKHAERTKRVNELLNLLGLAEAENKAMRTFSKGMLQRLGIAQSLINDPDILFWDEPMSGLDPIGRSDVRRILLELKKAGKTIFFNSHLMPDVNELCDRIGIVHRGRLLVDDTITKISKNGNYRDLEDYFLAQVTDAENLAKTAS